MTLGAGLHAANVPFPGLVLTAVGICIALTGYLFVPRAGAVLTIASWPPCSRRSASASIVLSPMIAIVVEALLAELGLALAGGDRTVLPLLLAGALAVLWALVHPFVTQGVLAGQGVLQIYTRTLEKVAGLLGLSSGMVVALIVIIVLAPHRRRPVRRRRRGRRGPPAHAPAALARRSAEAPGE